MNSDGKNMFQVSQTRLLCFWVNKKSALTEKSPQKQYLTRVITPKQFPKPLYIFSLFLITIKNLIYLYIWTSKTVPQALKNTENFGYDIKEYLG